MTDRPISAALPAESVTIAVDRFTEPFWEAARAGSLVAAQCAQCEKFRMPPTPFCPGCGSMEIHWAELSGTATVFSFTVVTHHPAVGPILMIPAVLDLDGAPGARLVSPIVGVDPADVHIGMAVTVEFVPIAGGWQLPVFTSLGERTIPS